MGRTAVLQEVRIMRFEDVYGRYQERRLSCESAAEINILSPDSWRAIRNRLVSSLSG